ncbi:hypothetical protein O1Q96_01550 (plasmid) [Streptomyces sp. Qhu-G9]|uniref:hypothetical protein n=1 Tax=Streptomyces sp. Qhu-G9 TaxID=3452799 RepID=UPI0022AC0692|nr:hypothetical protein [Streptomyces aurantiacus]WAU78539.1 hypothetical protein O1Q96_01550 [Streptomyces aurantiacus]
MAGAGMARIPAVRVAKPGYLPGWSTPPQDGSSDITSYPYNACGSRAGAGGAGGYGGSDGSAYNGGNGAAGCVVLEFSN